MPDRNFRIVSLLILESTLRKCRFLTSPKCTLVILEVSLMQIIAVKNMMFVLNILDQSLNLRGI